MYVRVDTSASIGVSHQVQTATGGYSWSLLKYPQGKGEGRREASF